MQAVMKEETQAGGARVQAFEGRTGRQAEALELLVVFSLCGQKFGLGAAEVREIIRIHEATRVPNAAGSIEGVVNLRGRILPVINLARKLDLAEAGLQPVQGTDSAAHAGADAARRTMMVVERDNGLAGLLVDEVNDVVKMSRSEVTPARLGAEEGAGYVCGTLTLGDGTLVTLLQADSLLSV
jgi:purine-binding chemotaxis protein CheW